MLKKLKNIILVDESQPLEKIKKQYKSRTYWFLGLSWLMSFLLMFVAPENIMQYNLAQSFVNFMGYVVPMVDGLEHIRVNGVEDEYLRNRLLELNLEVLPHISFYYAGMWLYSLLAIPYMILLVKKNFIYNKDRNFLQFLPIKKIIHNFYKRPIAHYLTTTVFLPFFSVFMLFKVVNTTKWFQMFYVYQIISFNLSLIFTVGVLLNCILHLYIHIRLKKAEKPNVK